MTPPQHYTLLQRSNATCLLGDSLLLSVCIVSKVEILCLHVQMTLINKIPLITIIRNFKKFPGSFHYQIMFLL